jgi:hypothetical protein
MRQRSSVKSFRTFSLNCRGWELIPGCTSSSYIRHDFCEGDLRKVAMCGLFTFNSVATDDFCQKALGLHPTPAESLLTFPRLPQRLSLGYWGWMGVRTENNYCTVD